MSELTEEDAQSVREWLNRHGFRHISSVGDARPFGDFQDTWEGGGSLIRLTRDRGRWRCDMSRGAVDLWLNVDAVAGAMGFKLTAPVERVAYVASAIDDRLFAALSSADRHSP